MTIELTEAEREYLLDILRNRLGELRQEVYHATVSKYHDELKERESLLRGIIEKAEAAKQEA